MNKLLLLSAAGALGMAVAMQAQSQTTPDSAQQTPETTTTQKPSTDTQGGETQDSQSQRTTQDQKPTDATPGTVNPQPQTSRTEGTAADRTPPGATPTREAAPGTVNPMPATSRAEGTAADRSPPGDTPVRGTAAESAPEEVTKRMAAAGAGAKGMWRASDLIGMQVQSTQGERLGTVKDVLINPNGQVTHVVLESRGGQGTDKNVIPWSAVGASGGRDEAIIIERSSMQPAPDMQQQ